MFGTEYNWLIFFKRPGGGAPRARLASSGLLTLAVAVFCFLCVALRAAPGRATGETAWAITDMDGIIEGLAIHSATLESFFSDVHNRCIWYRNTSGASAVMKKFSGDSDGLLGVFALKISADGQTLWATSSALPEMRGYTVADKGRAFLAADGPVFVSDSISPVIWRLTPGGAQLEKWLEHPGFKSLQGLVLSADGRSLHVSDYAQGLWRIAPATRDAVLLPAPAGANLRGIDGLYVAPGGGFIAVQNGTRTQRIIRLTLDAAGAPTAASELLAGHPAMTDLSLGQVVNGRFEFIGNSGWALYEDPKATPPARDVLIFSTPL